MDKNHLILKRGHCCECCSLKEWMGKPISLEIHHIVPNVETESNLQLLCPNCHSLTPNYRGRGIRTTNPKTDNEIILAVKNSKSLREVLIKLNLVAKGGNYEVLRKRLIALNLLDKFQIKKSTRLCLFCGLEIISKKKFCSFSCNSSFNQNASRAVRKTKIQWPPFEIVKKMTEEHSFLWAGKELGVSDNAVRKFLKKYSLAP